MTQTTTDLTAEIDAIADSIRQMAAACRHRPPPDSDRAAAHLRDVAAQSTRIAGTAVQAGDTAAAARLRNLAAECTELAAEARHRGHLQVAPR